MSIHRFVYACLLLGGVSHVSDVTNEPLVCVAVPDTRCSANEFQCANGNCIEMTFRCDGVSGDCTDNSDELNCGIYLSIYSFI